MSISKVISGGQTGADLGGLQGAKEAGVPTGGTAPKGWRTEAGANPELGSVFGLRESRTADYRHRTGMNACDSDATVIFSTDANSAGTKLTVDQCKKNRRPHLMIDPSKYNLEDPASLLRITQAVVGFVRGVEDIAGRPIVLNVAGNRESKSPGMQELVASIIKTVCLICNRNNNDTRLF